LFHASVPSGLSICVLGEVGPISIEHDFLEIFSNDVCRKTTIDEKVSDSIVAEIEGWSWPGVQTLAGPLNEADFFGAALADAWPVERTIGRAMARATRSATRPLRTERTREASTELEVISFILRCGLFVDGARVLRIARFSHVI